MSIIVDMTAERTGTDTLTLDAARPIPPHQPNARLTGAEGVRHLLLAIDGRLFNRGYALCPAGLIKRSRVT
jgi:hypothetical protein